VNQVTDIQLSYTNNCIPYDNSNINTYSNSNIVTANNSGLTNDSTANYIDKQLEDIITVYPDYY